MRLLRVYVLKMSTLSQPCRHLWSRATSPFDNAHGLRSYISVAKRKSNGLNHLDQVTYALQQATSFPSCSLFLVLFICRLRVISLVYFQTCLHQLHLSYTSEYILMQVRLQS